MKHCYACHQNVPFDHDSLACGPSRQCSENCHSVSQEKEHQCSEKNAVCADSVLRDYTCPNSQEKDTGWEAEIGQAVSSALEYRGFNDYGKYLDDTFLEHIRPIILREKRKSREAVVEYLKRMQDEGYIVDRHYEAAKNLENN